jgi:hypothetical protein
MSEHLSFHFFNQEPLNQRTTSWTEIPAPPYAETAILTFDETLGV